MKRRMYLEKEYIYIPVHAESDVRTFSIYEEGEDGKKQIFDFRIPVRMMAEERYAYDYKGELCVKDLVGKTISIEADCPDCMGDLIENCDKKAWKIDGRPGIHYAVKRGWSNDPNGMVYQNGTYHLYYQYNPFDTRWENMSWGHAVSKDLLHWEEKKPVLYPDANGTMFSGCGLVNERGLLGLPEDALLFYYTVAGDASDWSKGKGFTQNLAYSLDGGETLVKVEEPVIGELYSDSRDPKIFWHEKTQAYVMVLWLRRYEFGIFRSTDLKNWEMTQSIELEKGWECPDLFLLEDENGKEKWFFWAADGRYYGGDFDGYQFTWDGSMKFAYITPKPYAAQTYANVENRTISIPWLRLDNDGRLFTGAYGIPTEFSFTDTKEGSILVQKPVKELFDQLQDARKDNYEEIEGSLIYRNEKKDAALVYAAEFSGKLELLVNGSSFAYDPEEGKVYFGEYTFETGKGFKKIFAILDDCIFEVFFDDGKAFGTFEISAGLPCLEDKTQERKLYHFYEVF